MKALILIALFLGLGCITATETYDTQTSFTSDNMLGSWYQIGYAPTEIPGYLKPDTTTYTISATTPTQQEQLLQAIGYSAYVKNALVFDIQATKLTTHGYIYTPDDGNFDDTTMSYAVTYHLVQNYDRSPVYNTVRFEMPNTDSLAIMIGTQKIGLRKAR
jgi:hypothetical protein